MGDHTSDKRIWAHPTGAQRGEFHCSLHEKFVLAHRGKMGCLRQKS
jgi:hypothetical protein